MSPRQLELIKSLINEREIGSLSTDQHVYLCKLVAAEVDPSFDATSRIITALLALPRRDGQPVAAPAARQAEVAQGRYALVDPESGVVKFYSVDRPTEGRWQGRTFVNALASDERHPIRNRDSRNAILARIAEAPEAAMRLFAAELGRCGYCGRTLTDETSRAAGIGPDCADKHGIDRSVWAEQAMAEAAARVRGDSPAQAAKVELEQARIDVDEARYNAEFARVEREQELAAFRAGDEAERRMSGTSFNRVGTRRSDPSASMGWRERRAAVAAQQGQSSAERYARMSAESGRVHHGELPGTTWEDIFGMGGE